MNQSQMEMREQAQIYIELGLAVIPLCPANHRGMSETHCNKCKSPGKSPIVPGWPTRKSTAEEELTSWFNSNPNINLGLVLGQTDNHNLVGVDIDGALGEATLTSVAKGDVPDTWEYKTGSGRRLLYELPSGLTTKKSVIDALPGHQELALLVQGQQTVVPPSVHANGTKYEWKENCSPTTRDIALAPQWIIDAVTHADTEVQSPKDLENNPLAEKLKYSEPLVVNKDGEQVKEGGRSNYMTTRVGSLLRSNLTYPEVLQMAHIINKQSCVPPLDDEEIEAMVKCLADKEKEKEKVRKKKAQRREDMNPYNLAKLYLSWLNNQHKFIRYMAAQSSFYTTTLDQPPWNRVPDSVVQSSIFSFLVYYHEEHDFDAPSIPMRDNILEQLRELQIEYPDTYKMDPSVYPDYAHFAVNNGIVNWKTGELTPWTPDSILTYKINIDWVPQEELDADIKEYWEARLKEWLDDDDTIALVQEYIGYCLQPSTCNEVAMVFDGEGSNGKSLLMEAILPLFSDVSACISLSDLCRNPKVVLETTINKLFLYSTEASERYLVGNNDVKQLISGETVYIEPKYQKGFNYRPYSKILLNTNRWPRVDDMGYSWLRRFALIPFPHKFPQNPSFRTQYLNKMHSPAGQQVVFRWALEGLQRLYARRDKEAHSYLGPFTQSKTVDQHKEEYRLEADPITNFCSYNLVAVEGPISYKNSLPLDIIYDMYREWCTNDGLKPCSKPEFRRRLPFKVDQRVRFPGARKGEWTTKAGIRNCQLADDYAVQKSYRDFGGRNYQAN